MHKCWKVIEYSLATILALGRRCRREPLIMAPLVTEPPAILHCILIVEGLNLTTDLTRRLFDCGRGQHRAPRWYMPGEHWHVDFTVYPGHQDKRVWKYHGTP